MVRYITGYIKHSSLNLGTLLASPNHIWAGLSTVQELAKLSDIPETPDIPNVIDKLTSTSTIDALSANQGKVLKDLIDAVPIGLSVVESGSSYSGKLKSKQILFSAGPGAMSLGSGWHICRLIGGKSPYFSEGTLNISSGSYPASLLLFTVSTYGFGIIMETNMVRLFERDEVTSASISTNNQYVIYG